MTSPISLIDPQKLNPALILKRINTYARTTPDGRVSYTGLRYHEDIANIYGLFRFDQNTSQEIARASINRAVSLCIRDKKLTAKALLKSTRHFYSEAIGSTSQPFHLLTGLSLAPKTLFGSYTVGEAKVRILRSAFPKKYTSRKVHAEEYRNRNLEAVPENYAKVIAQVAAASEDLGFQAGMNAIDVIRGLININVTPAMVAYLGDEPYTPINKVLLGGLHTIHHENGTSSHDGFWHDPLARFPLPHKLRPDQEERVKKSLLATLQVLNRSKDQSFSRHLIHCLIQYVSAFDEPDPSNCLLKSWAALEQLLGEDRHGDGDRVIKRASFLYKNSEDVALTLNIIRHTRNDLAHRGTKRERLKTHCHQIHSYFLAAFRYYLWGMKQKKDRKECNDLLDLPGDIRVIHSELSLIKKRKCLLNLGQKFRTSE